MRLVHTCEMAVHQMTSRKPKNRHPGSQKNSKAQSKGEGHLFLMTMTRSSIFTPTLFAFTFLFVLIASFPFFSSPLAPPCSVSDRAPVRCLCFLFTLNGSVLFFSSPARKHGCTLSHFFSLIWMMSC